jgi:hypothetical protein
LFNANWLSPPTRMLRFEFTVVNAYLNVILLANIATIYSDEGIFQVEAETETIPLRLFQGAEDYVQSIVIFATNLLLFIIVYNDAKEKLSEFKLAEKAEAERKLKKDQGDKVKELIESEDDEDKQNEELPKTWKDSVKDVFATIWRAPGQL